MIKYIFPKDNQIEYTYHSYMPRQMIKASGIPYDREWHSEYTGIDDMVYIIAEGYGERIGTWGIGPILVKEKDIKQYEVQ